MHDVPTSLVVFTAVFAFVAGAVMGSFANCAAMRRGTQESVLHGRSRCASCGQVLAVRDLVPLASWIARRGRCAYCGEALSVRYPLTELAGAAAFALLAAMDAASWNLGLHTVQNLAFASILLYASLVDFDSRIIPNGCIVAAVAVRFAFIALCAVWEGPAAGAALLRLSLIGALTVGAGMTVLVLAADRVFGRESMGGGDLKLFAVAGLYFGWRQCLFLVVVACIIGIAGAVLTQRGVRLLGRQIPFGPAIAAACVLTMAFGGSFVSWYAGLF